MTKLAIAVAAAALGALALATVAWGGEQQDLREVLDHAAERRLFFPVPEGPQQYTVSGAEYWGMGFDEAGLVEKYPAEQWAAFELGEYESGRTRVVALLALNDHSKELVAFLEEGDVLALSLSYKDRLTYEWTDVVLDKTEERELILLEVDTLSYALPRIEGYSVLWYDRAAPDRVQQREHLSQGALVSIATALDPGAEISIDLQPGMIQVLYFPEIGTNTLPIEIETSSSSILVFGVLSGKMGLARMDPGAVPGEGVAGEKVVPLTVPGDLKGKDFWVVRSQPSSTFCLLHVPQTAKAGVKGKLVVGQPPGAAAE